jgi:hypothetical protein
MLHNILTKNAGTSIAKALEPLAGGIAGSIDIAKMQGSPASSEDCLFLDVYVPAKAMRGEVKLPVINWIYGGELNDVLTSCETGKLRASFRGIHHRNQRWRL